MSGLPSHKISKIFILPVIFIAGVMNCMASSPVVAYDMEMAQEICGELPLENVEGLWMYPDDKVTVMILRDEEGDRNEFPTYTISVVETSDARLHPGDVIGRIESTADEKNYRIVLSTERKNDLLLKPKSVLATLSTEGETLIIKKQKSPLKGRLNLNFSRLLPGFWKMVSIGLSRQNSNNDAVTPSVGMVKIYPSYDGNGSSKRKVRYL